MDLFETLVKSFQPLANAQKISFLGDVGVLDKPLDYFLFEEEES